MSSRYGDEAKHGGGAGVRPAGGGGDFFWGGNAFSRDENGKTKPPVSLMKLLKVLKVLEKHPDLLAEVRAD